MKKPDAVKTQTLSIGKYVKTSYFCLFLANANSDLLLSNCPSEWVPQRAAS